MKKKDNMAFLDLELTHLPMDEPLDAAKDSILECCVVVTDPDFKELARQKWVISHTKEKLSSLSEWHQKNFGKEGNDLFADVLASKTTREEMETELLALLKLHCLENMCRLAGNSVHCDREVLFHAMPSVYKFCSHQVQLCAHVAGVKRV